ncbi:hypothetical protein [Microbacterium sp. cx-59]|uniref:hypothetical protein n=1 Tax=Microbacterium sp. cx-59 TaxID=2891207 RepID=UPI001E58E2E5|nr:hypothetical protein [Microbacterium sp. cx-59]MCC4908455.1 hypothetical protein [Microbacterium sp. cx-59]
MNKSQQTPERGPQFAHGLEFAARALVSVTRPEVAEGEDEIDLDHSSVVLTIIGPVRALLDVSDGIADSYAEYSRLSRSHRRSDPHAARRFGDLAARMLEVSQALESAVLNPIETPRVEAGPKETAMDIVRRAQRGEISKAELVSALLDWEFEPSYRTRGLADDWETRTNSFDAVVHAYTIGLIDEETYGRITRRADDRESRSE